MAAKKILVAHGDLQDFVGRVFAARGMAPGDAATVAEVLVWANLRGVDSHGVSRVPRYLEFIDQGDMNPTARPQLRRLTDAVCLVESAHAAGPVAMMQAARAVVDAVPTTGICMSLVGQTTHAGAIGRYAHWIAERGHAAIVLAAGLPNMAYHGTRMASLSTSPIAIAVPSRSYGPILLDMATAVAAAGRINQARLAGQPIPDGWALSKDGTPTTNPAEADIALPLGGPKGSGLSFMFECLTSLLSGAPILSWAIGATGTRHNAQNAMIIGIDIARFRPLDEFCRDVDAVATRIKDLPRLPAVEEILLPGERGNRSAAERRATGVPISAKVWQDLGKVAAALTLQMPPARGD